MGLFCLFGTVQAQVTADPVAEQAIEEGLRRQEAQTREQLRAVDPPPSELRPEIRRRDDQPLPEEGECFVVDEIALTGPDAALFPWLAEAAKPHLHRCIGPRGLALVASDLDRALVEAGYVTSRVALPPQSLQSGRLVVRVEAGRIGEMRLVDAESSADQKHAWGSWRLAFPTSPGTLLNIRDLEHGVENLKRLPSQNATTRLEPGAQPGTSDVLVERPSTSLRDRIRGGLTLDNSGGASLGRTQAAANIAFDNPLGLSDIMAVRLHGNVERPGKVRHSQSASVHYSVPWGYNLFTLGASNSRFAQQVQGTTQRFVSSGRSRSVEARLQRTVWRTASSQLALHAGLSSRRAIAYLDDTEILTQRRRTTFIEAGLSYRRLFERSVLALEAGARHGVPWWGALPDLDEARDGGATLRPTLWNLDLSWEQELQWGTRAWRYRPNLRAQFSPDRTLSIDQVAIGGRFSVRGFNGDAVLLAENGFVLRNELTTPLAIGLGNVDFLVALDYGRVWGPSDVYLAGRQLAGAALGLRLRHQSLHAEAVLATPLHAPTGFPSRPLNLYVSLTHTF